MPCITYFDEEHSILLKFSCILPCTDIFPRGKPRAVYIYRYIRLGDKLDKAHGLVSPLEIRRIISRATLADHDTCLSLQHQVIMDFLPGAVFAPLTNYDTLLYLAQ